MIQQLHHLHFAKNLLQILLVQLTFVDDFDGNLKDRSERETQAIVETRKFK